MFGSTEKQGIASIIAVKCGSKRTVPLLLEAKRNKVALLLLL
jgi:hypothetical protein